jgi:hypothetical protein
MQCCETMGATSWYQVARAAGGSVSDSSSVPHAARTDEKHVDEAHEAGVEQPLYRVERRVSPRPGDRAFIRMKLVALAL